MRFEVYFRCYRYLGRLLNLFNFIGIINYLWHVDDIYLVSRTPDRMLMHWSRMQMYITYMGMFWGKTLWLDVCVFCGVGSGEPWIPSGDAGSSGSWSEWAKTCMRSTGQGFPWWIKTTLKRTLRVIIIFNTPYNPRQYIYGVRILKEDRRPPQPSEDPNAQLHLVAETLHCPP